MNDQIGPYQIIREVGRGGMGVVHLARDTRLDRDVAIKELPEHFAQDPARLERFEREAKALASLNHVNLAGIYGVEEQDGAKYLVLEYVEGETLADRLDRGALPLDEALELALQIAAGVEAAHEAGIIHRDLKPDNIKLTPEGKAKVLDFGLARADEAGTSSSGSGDSATMTAAQRTPTMEGAILGTAAYMSPEQARGRRVDKRTDIWSYGVVLYEMLVGASPFHGETASDSIGAVLHKDIDLNLLPAETPTAMRRVLQRCLTRDRDQRYRDIGDVRLELELRDRDAGDVAAARNTSRWALLALAAVALVAIGGWAFTGLRATPQAPADQQLSLAIPLPPGMEIASTIDISRDGKTVVFAAWDDGEQLIYLRDLDDFAMRKVSGSRDGLNPAFSPDGKSIVFQARNKVFRASVAGGPPVQLTNAKWLTADWSEDETIVFSEGVNSPLISMPAGGGTRTPLTDLADNQAYGHVWPQRIPGTSKMLFTVWKAGGGGGAHILDLDSGEAGRLDGSAGDEGFLTPARWSASGHLIFEAFDSGLLVVPFDPDSGGGVTRSEARPLVDGVYSIRGFTRSVFALSEEGTLVYAPGTRSGRRLVWVAADGETDLIVEQKHGERSVLGAGVVLSADDASVFTWGGGDPVEVDLERKLPRHIPIEGRDSRVVLAADGRRIYYASSRDTRWSVWSVGLDAGAEPEMVLQRDENTFPLAAAPNGDLLVMENRVGFGLDLLIMAPSGDVRPLATTSSNEESGAFSVDGSWVAFDSDISGRFEVYVTRADGSGSPVQVSTDGGQAPKFGRSGQTLYFRRHRAVMRVGFDDGRPVGEAVAVFAAPNLAEGYGYDITADETRMVTIQLDDDAIPTELRVITNFFDVIREAVGTAER